GLIYYEADPDEIEDWKIQRNLKTKNIFNVKKFNKKTKNNVSINVSNAGVDGGGNGSASRGISRTSIGGDSSSDFGTFNSSIFDGNHKKRIGSNISREVIDEDEEDDD